MKLTLTIDLANSAFEWGGDASARDGTEVSRILFDTSRKWDGDALRRGDGLTLRDLNGNVVGYAKIK